MATLVYNGNPSDGGTDDFVTTLDACHDVNDPVGVASHVHDTLTVDGTWMTVELFANDRVEGPLDPMGRAAYWISALICTPGELAQGDRGRTGGSGWRVRYPGRGHPWRFHRVPPRRRNATESRVRSRPVDHDDQTSEYRRARIFAVRSSNYEEG